MDAEVIAMLKESGLYYNVMLGLRKMQNHLKRALTEDEIHIFVSGYSQCFIDYLEAKERTLNDLSQ